MHDQHIICGALISPISHPECYCRVHRDELSGLTTKLERAREASTHARAALAYTMRRLQQRYASYDDAITDLRKYILVLNEQIKLEDVYLRCFGNPGKHLLSSLLSWSLRDLIDVFVSFRGHTTREQPEGKGESRTEGTRRIPRDKGTGGFFARACLGTPDIERICGHLGMLMTP